MPSRSADSLADRRRALLRSVPGLEAAEALFESIPSVIFCVKDEERRYVAANEAFVRSAGLRRRADLIGRTAREVFPVILAAGYEQQDDEVFRRGAALRDRLEMVTRPDGSIGWFVSQKLPVRDLAGRIVALAGISRDLAVPAAAGRGLDALGRAIERLHRDFALPLRIADLARTTGLSASQFQRRVAALTGLTPRQLLTKARVEAAARRLRDDDAPLGMLALDCGFYDQSAFSRQFRAATGLSPLEYRRALRG